MLKLYLANSESSGGDINLKLKIKNSKLLRRARRGFTLVEIVVVMGIMATMMLFSTSAFMTIRDQYTADQTAEALLTTIREAQNKAISISKDSAGNETKVWAIGVANNNFSLGSYHDQGINLYSYIEKGSLNPQPTTITVYKVNGTTEVQISGGSYVAYTAPFAKSYLLTGDSCTGNNGGCEWVRSARPTEEWEIPLGQIPLLADAESLKFVIRRGMHTSVVIVKSNGDAYIE